MKELILKKNNITTWIISIITALFAALLLVGAKPIAEGISHGLRVSAGVLVPALFPFMVLSGFVSMTGYGRALAMPFRIVLEKWFKLPAELGALVLLSMIGGYPVGARMISSLLHQKKISAATAERMLCFCVNAGPSFVITAVGTGMFLSARAGLILFGTQILASVVIGIIVSVKEKLVKINHLRTEAVGAAPAFVQSVTGASLAMIHLCAFAVLFSGVLSLFGSLGVPQKISGFIGVSDAIPEAIISGLFEVTSGCIAASRIGGAAGFGLASAYLSFGGISVLFQLHSFFKDTPIRMGRFLLSRVLHMMVSTAFAIPLFRVFCDASPAWASAAPPPMISDTRTILISLCLLGMCSALVLAAQNTGHK